MLSPPHLEPLRTGRNKSNPRVGAYRCTNIEIWGVGCTRKPARACMGFDFFVHLPSGMVSPKACGCGWEDWHLARRQLSSNLIRIVQPTSARGRGLATIPAAASAMAIHHVDARESALMKSLHADDWRGGRRSLRWRSGAPTLPAKTGLWMLLRTSPRRAAGRRWAIKQPFNNH